MPDWRMQIRVLVGDLKLDPPREAEIIEELNQHLNDKYEELLIRGVPSEEAGSALIQELKDGKLDKELRSLRQAKRQSIVLGKEEHANLLAELWKDLRFGARLLRLNPGFAMVAIFSLALGIGANTAIFQLINVVRLRALPVENPQELAQVKIVKAPNGRTGAFKGSTPHLTYAIWQNVRDRQKAFSSMGAWYSQRLNLNRGGEARYAQALFVSGGFFDTLGIRPILGRLITLADDRRGCGSSGVVLNDSFCKRQFAASPSALGSKITLEGHPFEVIGVAPAKFFGVEVGRRFDVALPLCAEQIIQSENPNIINPQAWWLGAIGRLKAGWTIDQASAQLAAISPGIFEATLPFAYDGTDTKNYLQFALGALPGSSGVSSVREQYENPLWLLMAISGLVLLIACANLANLMVARASSRQREMAMRLALGASRNRLIRQMLAESLLLAVIGAAFGTALAQILSRLLITFLSTERTQLFLDLQPDWRVLAFTAGLAILTCVLFGLMPAIQSASTEPGELMKGQGRGNTAGRERLGVRRTLVVSQVALSLVLLVGALLFVRTFRNLVTLEAGFRQDNLLVTIIDLTPVRLPAEQRNAYKQNLLDHIRAIPGVNSAADISIVPLSGSGWNENISIQGKGVQREIANFNQVSPGYFRTVGTPLLAGRDFNERDTATTPYVAIVTETFAKKFLKGSNPVGTTFGKIQQEGKPDRIYQIVGLVKDTKYFSLREDFTPIVFIAEAQDNQPWPDSQVIIRSYEPLSRIVTSVKQVVAEVDPNLVIDFKNFQTLIRESLIRERLMAMLSGFFGFLAAVLAMIGLYGVISYLVIRRRNEIGIRMALGANQRSILSLIMREAAILLGIGLAIGTILALIAGRTARALLFGMQPSDPITLTLAITGLAAIALFASFLPARRAASVNPMQALREE
jgi:putative ABC transport system permease protein